MTNNFFEAGNLVADPELRFTPNGVAVARLRMVSSRSVRDESTGGYKNVDEMFLDVNVWRQQAENVVESLEKGMRIVVIGRLKQRTYENQEGQRRTIFEVEAAEIGASLLFATAKITKASKRTANGQPAPEQPQPAAPPAAPQQPAQQPTGQPASAPPSGDYQPPF